MPTYPNREFARDIAGALAAFFSGGSGPSHATLTTAFAAAGIAEPEGLTASKEARVHAAFAQAGLEQCYILADEILMILRNDRSSQGPDQQDRWTRARAAFARAGAVLDGGGFADWGIEAPRPAVDPERSEDSHEPVEPQFSSRAASTMRPQLDRAVTAGVSAVIAASASARPSGDDALSRGAYHPGDAIRASAPGFSEDGPRQIFLVHGHDTNSRNAVETFVTRTTRITPTVLALESSQGRTLIEKFEEHAGEASFAIVLMTADDEGRSRQEATSEQPPRARARQNVVFELGYFVGALGRSSVVALVEPGVERPSDIAGIVYIAFQQESAEWREELRRELRAAEFPIVN